MFNPPNCYINGYTGVLGGGSYVLNNTASANTNGYKTGNSTFTFQGGPKFTYAAMTRIGIRSATVTPTNGLESVVVLWYTPGTKQITYLRRYIKTDGVTWKGDYHTMKWVYTWQ